MAKFAIGSSKINVEEMKSFRINSVIFYFFDVQPSNFVFDLSN